MQARARRIRRQPCFQNRPLKSFQNSPPMAISENRHLLFTPKSVQAPATSCKQRYNLLGMKVEYIQTGKVQLVHAFTLLPRSYWVYIMSAPLNRKPTPSASAMLTYTRSFPMLYEPTTTKVLAFLARALDVCLITNCMTSFCKGNLRYELLRARQERLWCFTPLKWTNFPMKTWLLKEHWQSQQKRH